MLVYNQELYIKAALSSALKQTYSPLEIIVLDDCSADASFEIVSELVKNYGGPHRVILHRNHKNIGIAAQVNQLIDMASGEYIVFADGDDVSEPSRVEQTVQRFRAVRSAQLVYTDIAEIDQSGRFISFAYVENSTFSNDLPAAINAWCPGTRGCSMAIRRSVLRRFGHLVPGTVSADRVFAFRAVLSGCIERIESPLVNYRRHCGGVSQAVTSKKGSGWINRQRGFIGQRLVILRNYQKDLELNGAVCVSEVELLRALETVERKRRTLLMQLLLMRRGSVVVGGTMAIECLKLGVPSFWIVKAIASRALGSLGMVTRFFR